MTAQKVRVDKRSSVSLLVFFLVLAFLGAVVFTLARHRGAVRQEESIKAANAARESFSAARDLLGLDDEEAREKLALGKESVERAKRLGLNKRRLQELQGEYREVRRNLLRIKEVSVRPVYKFGRDAVSDIGYDWAPHNRLLFLDRAEGKVKALTGLEGEGGVREAVLLDDVPPAHKGLIISEELLGSWGDDSFRVRGRVGGVGGVGEWGEGWKVADVSAFANWVYALSGEEDQIFKFYNPGKDFARRAWLGAELSVGEGALLGIDGDVYVWSDILYKFRRGREADFYLRLGLEEELKEVRDLAVWPESTFIYLLDSANGRVLQITKEGLLENQYVSERLKGAQALAVNSSETKALVLAGTTVLEITLR